MIKILYASMRPYYPLRIAHGGQRSIHDLLTAAKQSGDIRCAALCYSDLDSFPPKEQWTDLGIESIYNTAHLIQINCGYPVYAVKTAAGEENYWRQFDNIYNDFKPDVILTAQRHAMKIVRHAHTYPVPVIWNLDTSPGQVKIYEIPDLVEACGLGNVTICCSEYVQKRIRELSAVQVDSFVVYPIMPREQYRLTEHTPRHLTLINPVDEKGGNLLEPLIEGLPKEEFLFVEGWEMPKESDFWICFKNRMQKYNNVKVIPRVSDIRTVFRETKLLLVPSQWDEALGRVAWEAQCAGIPCLASRTGGLPEAVGTGGELVEDFTSAAAWVGAVRAVLYEPGRLERLYSAARESSRRTLFEPAANISRFMQAVQALKK